MRFLSNVKSRSRNPTVGQPLGIFICQSKIQNISPMSNAALSCEGRLQKSLLLQVRPYKARKMHKPCLFQGRGNAHTTQGKKPESSRSNTFRTCMLALGSTVLSSSSSRPASCAQYTLKL